MLADCADVISVDDFPVSCSAICFAFCSLVPVLGCGSDVDRNITLRGVAIWPAEMECES